MKQQTNLVHIGGMPDGVQATQLGLTITCDMPFDTWTTLMDTLSRMNGAFQWMIGDALNYGSSKYGEKYSQALESTQLTYSALANFSWVARSVPIENRNSNLSWTHHRAVSKLDPTEQRRLLGEAERSGWTADTLVDIIRGEPTSPTQIEENVSVPPGLSQKVAKQILDTAACLLRDDIELCNHCPYHKGK